MRKQLIFPGLIILFFSIFWLFRYSNSFFSSTNIDGAEKTYSKSQYVLGDAAEKKIDDATVYRYAAYRYAQGEDPTKINFEHPPFGKYILGFSWLLFGNMTVFNFGLYVGFLILFWQLSSLIIKNFNFRLLALFLMSCLELLPYYVFQSMLDIQLLFFTFSFFCSLFFIKNKKLSIIFTGLSLGAFASIKYYFPVLFLLGMILAYISFSKKKLKILILPLFIAVLFYLLTYFRYFLANPNPLDFIKFEWYRFRWWTGDRSMPKFLILGTILVGKFEAWWEKGIYEVAPNWSILWPISLIGWLISMPLIKRNFKIISLFLFSLLLFLMYCFGSAASERYLIQLIPFWILGLAFLLEKLYLKFNL